MHIDLGQCPLVQAHDPARREGAGEDGGGGFYGSISRRRDCHFTDTLSL